MLRYSLENTLTTSLVTRSYVDSLLSSSFVIWIDEQYEEERKKRTNTV